MKRKVFVLMALILAAAFALSASSIFSGERHSSWSENRLHLALRKIGDQLLRSSGDTTSRVLPIRQADANTYQISFASNFEFLPDSLVSIVNRNFVAANITKGYIVNVLDCSLKNIVYGYEFLTQKEGDAACLGRHQPKGCYQVNVVFLSEPESQSTSFAWLGAGIAIFALGFVGARVLRDTTSSHLIATDECVKLGRFQFSAEKRFLVIDGKKKDLSHKETKVLKILAGQVNSLVTREQLMKEVWEDEGVIVGRSLDVFISRLRKKLQDDPNIKLVNVHGQGYQLETN